MSQAGFDQAMLDFAMFCSEYELEGVGKRKKKGTSPKRLLVSEHPGKLYDKIKPVMDRCIQERISLSVARAPYLCRDTRREDLGELVTRLTEECIRICGKTGCTSLIVRPLFVGIRRRDEWETNRKYYLHFLELARENNVTILLENQCRDRNGHLVRGVCADGREAARWVDRLNEEAGEERFGFCMDIGACSLCGQDMREFALLLGDRIRAVILRECDGHTECSRLPFTCAVGGQSQTDWLGLIRGLRETGFDGQLILDFSDTAGAFSPILRPGLMKLARSTAEYFGWQVGLENLLKKYPAIVLFGAGNMCRNYMKCYGEKYTPLFTCDNNQALWGTMFCGLEVKPPESLKELPKDCVIFICNIYYREIERQLRSMGIRNPIEFFNDEYMPAFYFDRIERE
jgi:sugar phosphate isomerase/epimerase